MPKIDQGWTQESNIQRIFDALEEAGGTGWFVGGCVRDALLGREIRDVDIATDITPQDAMQATKNAGLKTVPTGIDHGTITVVSENVSAEITTLRKDIHTDGRYAVVEFSSSLEDDAARRDFTMNALYADRQGLVIDPLGQGVEDALLGRVHFIGHPSDRIREDHLRSLRYFRFFASHGAQDLGLDPEALSAISKNVSGLHSLSRERITAELLRLLETPDPMMAVSGMATTGVLSAVLPGAHLRYLGPLLHAESKYAMEPDAIRRLASLGGEEVAKMLRLSRDQARQLKVLLEGFAQSQKPQELGYRFGPDRALDILVLRSALFERAPEEDWRESVVYGASQMFPVSAGDLMPEYQGAALGKRLKALEERWIASGFALSKDALLKMD